MAKKFVVKTTEEFIYDKEDRIIKKITTEESYETEIAKTTAEDILRKATGVPNTATIKTTNPPWTVSYDSVNTAKADTNGITQNTINIVPDFS